MSKVTLKIEIDEEDFKSTEYATLLYHLNATPLDESDDCVSRQAVIDIVKKNCIPLEPIIIKHLEDLPSVLPKREQGEWIRKTTETENDGIRIMYECSKCGVDQLFEEPYCPNCGAEMR